MTIYIGATTNLSNRLYQHLMANRRASTLKNKLINKGGFVSEDSVKDYLRKECVIQFIIISDPEERTLFEHLAIAILHLATIHSGD